ncbi:TOBE domain-containing protein [Acinetobacter baumannii]
MPGGTVFKVTQANSRRSGAAGFPVGARVWLAWEPTAPVVLLG